MKRLTSEWVEKAEGDHRATAHLLAHANPVVDAVYFHAQQCVKKYLKAWLVEQGTRIPRTHDLDQLGQLVSPTAPEVATLAPDLSRLAAYAVEVRYPGPSATLTDAQWSVNFAREVRRIFRTKLGI